MKAGVVDYGMGNLASVSKALQRVGADAFVSDDEAELSEASLIVLPGVGNFGAGMANLRQAGLEDFLVKWARDERPLLGICLGMQMFFERSTEAGESGLGILPGEVVRFGGDIKVPHMGWNTIAAAGPTFSGFDGAPFYFVHSYYCVPAPGPETATTGYGVEFASAVRAGSVAGVQFHPEKSSAGGLDLLAHVYRELQ